MPQAFQTAPFKVKNEDDFQQWLEAVREGAEDTIHDDVSRDGHHQLHAECAVPSD